MFYCKPLAQMSQESQEEWDRFVEHSSHCHYRQTCKWLWLTTRQGFEPFIITVRDAAGHISGGAAVLKRSVPLLPYCWLTVPYGPICANVSIWQNISAAFVQMARQHKTIFLRVTPYIAATDASQLSLLTESGFQPRPERYSIFAPAVDLMWVDIHLPLDALLGAFSRETRYKIRQAYRDNIEVDDTGSVEALTDMGTLFRETSQHGWVGWNYDDMEHYRGILSQFQEHAKLIVIRHNGIALACGVFIALDKTCWFLEGGTTRSTKIQAARALHWEAIQWAHSRGCVRYDMLGGATFPTTPSQPGCGLYRFKASLNAHPVPLGGYYDLVFSQPLYNLLLVAERNIVPYMGRWLSRLARRPATRTSTVYPKATVMEGPS